MRYSKLFSKTTETVPAEAETISHRYLIRGGFTDKQLASGIYSFLPLGWRVHDKIAAVIREEMNRIGGQEVFLPTLQPKTLWEESDRWRSYDPKLFVVKDRHRREYALAPTHEEVITDLCRRLIRSYRDLPVSIYQIQTKFRNELRSSGGLLRTREFVMKDLYSFHETEADLDRFYQEVFQAYLRIYHRCGLREVRVVEAESGSIGGSYCHEFMTLTAAGEDKILACEGCSWAANLEAVKKAEVKQCPKCGSRVAVKRGIENGHVFKLGAVYSEKMGAYFVDSYGIKKPVVMGCYGIGLGRLMATIVEVFHDDKGIIWPQEVAPYQVSLIGLPGAEAEGERIYQQLSQAGVEVLWDEREESAGVKFTDSDLIGLPWRAVVSKKTGDRIELKRRDSHKTKLVSVTELKETLVAADRLEHH